MGAVYNIPESRWPWFEDQIKRLDKKAHKICGEGIDLMVIGKHTDDESNKRTPKMIYEVLVDMPAVKIDGYEFMGTLDHGYDEGNIIRAVPGGEIPENFYNAAPNCTHCGFNRKRNSTFVLRCEEDKSFHQIGRTCLHDFTGHKSAEQLAKLAELLAEIPVIAHTRGAGGGDDSAQYVEAQYAAAMSYYVITRYGYYNQVRSKATGEPMTKSRVLEKVWDYANVSLHEEIEGRKALEYMAAIPDTSEWAHNVRVLAGAPAINVRHMGVFVSGVQSYIKHKGVNISDWQGMPGSKERIEMPMELVSGRKMSNGDFLYKFSDFSGNVYAWFSKENFMNDIGRRFKISARVRRHSEYGGVKQTELNWMRIIPA